MNDIDLLLVRAQVSLTKITLAGFLLMLFTLLMLLFVPGIKASPEIISLVSAATGSLGTILTQQNGYFFARHRQPNDTGTDPTPTTPPQAAKTTP